MELTDFEIISIENDYTIAKINDVPFHIQGGGQPSDKLFDSLNQPIEIIRNEVGTLLKFKGIVDSKIIELKIDSNFRSLCSRLHSAGHFISLILSNLYSTNPTKAHHFPNECYVKFDSEIPRDDIVMINEKINHILDQSNFDVDEFYIGDIRTVRFGQLGKYECGGTHVKKLQEIGSISIDNISNKKGSCTVKYSLK